MKNYSKIFGLTKPERTTEKSAQNLEIERNRRNPPPEVSHYMGSRRWLNSATISWIIRCTEIGNSRRKRGERGEFE